MKMDARRNLTTKELDVFLAIMEDEYSDGTADSRPWSWSVVSGSRSRAGVLSSLVKKGLVWCQGEGRDAVCGYTDAGKALLGELQREGSEG
jgi:hypothetical protein